MKKMDEELFFFLNKIKNHEPFALSRWGDGEYKLMRNIYFSRSGDDLEKKKVWEYDPSDEIQKKCASIIVNSLDYEEEGFYWGITCPVCDVCNISGLKHYEKYENKQNLTFASLFVNANHELFQERMPKVVENKIVYFVGHKDAKVDNLPFEVKKHFKVGTNSWIHNLDILDELMNEVQNKKEIIVLFACGPLSSYLITNLWKENKNNIYVDIGSSYDMDLYGIPTRGFHKKIGGYGLTCQWFRK